MCCWVYLLHKAGPSHKTWLALSGTTHMGSVVFNCKKLHVEPATLAKALQLCIVVELNH